MSDEEKKAIELLKKLQKKTPYIIWGDGTPYNKSNQIQTILNVIDRQQKEINFYKNEELTYITGYEDGKRHKQTAVMIKKENEQQELFEKEIVRLKEIIEKQQKEIEEKTTIIMAGAEKVKRLESQIEELLNVLNNEKKINYIKPIDIKIQNYISEDEIRELIKKYQEIAEDVKQKYKGTYAYRSDYLEALAKIEGYQELLEE